MAGPLRPNPSPSSLIAVGTLKKRFQQVIFSFIARPFTFPPPPPPLAPRSRADAGRRRDQRRRPDPASEVALERRWRRRCHRLRDVTTLGGRPCGTLLGIGGWEDGARAQESASDSVAVRAETARGGWTWRGSRNVLPLMCGACSRAGCLCLSTAVLRSPHLCASSCCGLCALLLSRLSLFGGLRRFVYVCHRTAHSTLHAHARRGRVPQAPQQLNK